MKLSDSLGCLDNEPGASNEPAIADPAKLPALIAEADWLTAPDIEFPGVPLWDLVHQAAKEQRV